METLEERLRRDLKQLSPPGDPAGVVDRVFRKAARRHARRGAGIVLLTISVIAGSVAGFYGLTRMFGIRDAGPISFPAVGNGRIAFVQHDGEAESPSSLIAMVEPDGSGRVDLVRVEGLVSDLEWSPDGRRLAYGRHVLFVFDLDTGVSSRLTAPGVFAYGPSWSPDGSRIVFSVDRSGESHALYVANADGSDATVLTEASNLGWADWSPDGARVLFVGPGPESTPQGWDIYVMDSDGTDVTNLTNSDAVELDPNWSPDGSTILFRSRRDPPPGWVDADGDSPDELYLMAPDGSDVRRLTNDDAIDQSPVWSPDGRLIAFTSFSADEDSAVYTMRPDGTDRTKLIGITSAVVIAWQPLPDGELVSHPPSATETPADSPSPEGIVDLGLGFPVCNVTSVTGDFAAPAEQGVAYVATKVSDAGGCPPGEEGPFQIVAVDLNGDQRAEAWHGPLECFFGCQAFAAPDIDGDGTHEVAVSVGMADGIGVTLFQIEASDGGVTIEPIEVAPPGDPAGTFLPGPLRFQWGGNVGIAGGAYCGEMEGNPPTDERGFVVWSARFDEFARPSVHQVLFRVIGADLEVVAAHDYRAPNTPAGLPPGGGADLCGAPVI